ncbi:divergent polysaccharide deacteylase family protein [Roseivivax sp. THAF30]|uniref:divergent polysaccharide deacteylase family protein n=1 Tax=Roseivivax sp. THAF30 TaxID=2587852 RepID=UPI001267C89C|nr:divergent polysaccharide deacteylase family protein [Roseivivax sp. THAF30]QFT62843.1 Divergent polysaccharide deacetylase [Roseivivax sp. THAF30]
MARGFLAGAATGLIVSVGAAAGISLNMGYPELPAGLMPEPQVDDAGSDDVAAPEAGTSETAAPGEDAAPELTGDTAGLAAPTEGDTVPESVETESGSAPEVAEADAGLDAPAPDAAPEGIEASEDQPVDAAPDTSSPEAPGVESEPSISTDPAQPPAPDVTEETPGLDQPAAADADEADTAETEEAPAEDAAPAPEAEDDIAGPTPPEPDSERPSIGTPATSLTDREDGARSTRLPSIGADEESDTSEAESEEPPVRRFAADAQVEEGTPRLAIVLIDDGSGPLGPAALEAFPFAVTFAVDPTAEDAAERMRGYRERGFEVMALADVPDGAAASDVEVTLEASLRAVPEAVGILEAPGGGLQGSRDVTEQVADYLAASGHGLVMQGQGLNTAASLARREGVPSGSVFRDFDGDGQDPAMQRRLLDRVAMRASQDGAVIALGRLRADTVSALLLWGLQDRANELALVPVSAVISAEE